MVRVDVLGFEYALFVASLFGTPLHDVHQTSLLPIAGHACWALADPHRCSHLRLSPQMLFRLLRIVKGQCESD